MRRSNLPRGNQAGSGNWKMRRSSRPIWDNWWHRLHSTVKVPRSARGLSEVVRMLSDSARASEYSAFFPTGRATVDVG
jgi:hypothetical protein